MATQLTLVFQEATGAWQTRQYRSASGAWPWPLRDLYNARQDYFWIERSPEKVLVTKISPRLPAGRTNALLRKMEIVITEENHYLQDLQLAVNCGSISI